MGFFQFFSEIYFQKGWTINLKINVLIVPRTFMYNCFNVILSLQHEELVLLLIQLRRQQAMLETTQAQCKRRLDDLRDNEKTYRRV